MGIKLKDGIVSLTQKLANRRNAHLTNRMTHQRVDWDELRAIYKTGIGSKIIRLKSGLALDDTLQFESQSDKDFYEVYLQPLVKKAVKYQLAFGRALIVPHEPNADLSQPIGNVSDWAKVRYHVFSGDMVHVSSVELDLASPDYFKPRAFNVRAANIHPKRAVDFKYVEPVEFDAATYNFGGISEFELIRNELVNDQVVQRAVPGILERCSTLFYKVEGFKELLADRKEQDLLIYLAALEDTRSIYGAGVVDANDEIQVHNQQLSNLSDSDMITLRRLAMVTGLPLSWLVGEAARGLNSTGEGERQVLRQTIETLQSEYILEPVNQLMALHGRGRAWFKENQGEAPSERVEYEQKALKNALILYQLGEDYRKYLQDKDVITPDAWDQVFPSVEEEALPQPDQDIDLASLLEDD